MGATQARILGHISAIITAIPDGLKNYAHSPLSSGVNSSYSIIAHVALALHVAAIVLVACGPSSERTTRRRGQGVFGLGASSLAI